MLAPFDGFIAREDGSFRCFPVSVERLSEFVDSFPETFPAHFQEARGIRAENKQFDAVLMGRKTYEVGLNVGITNPYPSLKQYVFSRTMKASPDENIELVSDNPVAVVKELKKETGKDIWLCGGSALATTLFSEIDEMIVKLNPLVIGSGIPLFPVHSIRQIWNLPIAKSIATVSCCFIIDCRNEVFVPLKETGLFTVDAGGNELLSQKTRFVTSRA